MWYIISYNQIRGFLNGSFSDLDMLFYEGTCSDYGENSYRWTNLITDAARFEDAKSAREYINAHWKKHFGDGALAVMEIPEILERREDSVKEFQSARDATWLHLVTSHPEHITGEDLDEMAANYTDRGLTWREAQLIKIVRRLSDAK